MINAIYLIFFTIVFVFLCLWHILIFLEVGRARKQTNIDVPHLWKPIIAFNILLTVVSFLFIILS